MGNRDRRKLRFRWVVLAGLALLPTVAAAQVAAGPESMLSASGSFPAVAARGGAIVVV